MNVVLVEILQDLFGLAGSGRWGGGENGDLAGNAKIPHKLQYQMVVLAVVSGHSLGRLAEKKLGMEKTP